MNPVAKRIVTALTLAAVLVCAIIYAPPQAFWPAVGVLSALAVVEYGMLLARKLRPASVGFAFWFLAGSAFLVAALSVLPFVAGRYGNFMLLFVIAIVKISDMGGFAFGMTSARLMKGGNHKLCPSVSPNKSWEGLFGSVFGSCLVGFGFMPITGFSAPQTLVLAVTAALVGTAGDLVESKFKRWVGVKDSSTLKITNGMGGILDMLDSLLIAPAVLTAILVFWK